MSETSDNGRGAASKVGLILGPVLFLTVLVLPPPTGMPPGAKRIAAVTLWMAVWWLTEAVPLTVTAFIPLALIPLLRIPIVENGVATGGFLNIKAIAARYGDRFIFLFMGGFILAAGLEKWNLHKRLALQVISWVGTTPKRIVLGFMCAAAFLSMWISNTAATLIMLPIAAQVIACLRSETPGAMGKRFGVALMLGIAYAASIGGMGTLIGTPPNGVFAVVVDTELNRQVTFLEWFKFGFPMVVIMVPITWLYLTGLVFPVGGKGSGAGAEVIRKERRLLGPIRRGELLMGLVFAATAAAWMLTKSIKIGGGVTIPGLDRLFPGIHEATVAMVAVILIFAIPVRWKKGEFLMDWASARKIPWGVLFLFGGGLALALCIEQSGLTRWLAERSGVLSGLHPLVLILSVVAISALLTEITSNTATASVFMPALLAVAVGLGLDPYALMLPSCLACSMAFMLPVATPPNAVAYSTGYIQAGDMAKAGAWLNLIAILVWTVFAYYVALPIMGIKVAVGG